MFLPLERFDKNYFLIFYSVKTEYPPEWILIPSVLPLFTTASHSISSSTLKPDLSTMRFTEATRFPTRKPIESTTKVASTSESIIRPISIHTISPQVVAAAAATKQPQTTISASTEKSSVTATSAAAPTTTSQTIYITDNNDEEILSTTDQQRVTMFNEFEETTTATADYTEISETEHILNYTTSAPSVVNTQSIVDTTVRISEYNSTESSATMSQTASQSFGMYTAHNVN